MFSNSCGSVIRSICCQVLNQETSDKIINKKDEKSRRIGIYHAEMHV